MNIFESEDIRQLEKERMRLYMKVKNWKKSGKDTSELEKQLNDTKKRLSDAKKAVRLAAKAVVVTPQQTTPSPDDLLSGSLGTDGFGSLDIDALMGSVSDDILIKHNIKQFILDNYLIKEKIYDACVEVVKQKNGEYIVNYGPQKSNGGPTITTPKLQIRKTATSLTGGLFKWGRVRHLFCNNSNISTLEGAPQKCDTFICSYCDKLTTLEGAPQKCDAFSCSYCDKLTTLEGAPQECDTFRCESCDGLKSLKGAPEKCNNFICDNCHALIDLIGSPQEVTKYFCSNCKKLKSLKGSPKTCKYLDCNWCSKLTSLEDMPGECEIIECEETGIKDLTGAAPNAKIINISGCKKITSLKGCPANLKSLMANDCKNLIDATDLPKNIAVSGRNTPALKSMQQTIFI